MNEAVRRCHLGASSPHAPAKASVVGQSAWDLVTLGWKQQPFTVATEALALGASTEEIVEAGGIVSQASGAVDSLPVKAAPPHGAI